MGTRAVILPRGQGKAHWGEAWSEVLKGAGHAHTWGVQPTVNARGVLAHLKRGQEAGMSRRARKEGALSHSVMEGTTTERRQTLAPGLLA